MAPSTPIPSRWSLVDDASEAKPPKAFGCTDLVAPGIPRSSLTPLLSGLLPNRDHNEDFVRRLQGLPKTQAAEQPVFAVFAADPFFKGKRIAQRLREKNYSRVVNWPTTAQYGTEFCQALDTVNLGPQQEYSNLLYLAQQGLSISLAVCSVEAAAEFSRLKPEVVFLVPTFEMWTNGKLRSAELLRRCASLARLAPREIPIVLMAARGSLSPSQARKAGASGLLLA